jgi:hypothetical protein
MSRGVLLAALLVSGAVAGWFSWSVFRTPTLTEPQAIASSPYRVVLDCLRVPNSVSAQLNGVPVEVPGSATRFLVGELRQGAVVAGWVASPEDHPQEVVTVGSGATSLIGYCDRHREGVLVIEALNGWNRDHGTSSLTIEHRP